MNSQTQARYHSTINIQCPTGELISEIQRFCDVNSKSGVKAEVRSLPSDNVAYGIEIKLYNDNTLESKIIYLTRYDLSLVITPKFKGKIVPESITWRCFGNRNRDLVIAASLEVFSKAS